MYQDPVPFLIGDEEYLLRQVFHRRIVAPDHSSDIGVYGRVFFPVHFFITSVSRLLLPHNISPLPSRNFLTLLYNIRPYRTSRNG